VLLKLSILLLLVVVDLVMVMDGAAEAVVLVDIEQALV
jgi:hypothetical protein